MTQFLKAAEKLGDLFRADYPATRICCRKGRP